MDSQRENSGRGGAMAVANSLGSLSYRSWSSSSLLENSDFIYLREQTLGLSSDNMCCLDSHIILG